MASEASKQDNIPNLRFLHGGAEYSSEIWQGEIVGDNAVKFTNEGGKIIINAATDKKYTYFSVTNTGKGIPKDTLQHGQGVKW